MLQLTHSPSVPVAQRGKGWFLTHVNALQHQQGTLASHGHGGTQLMEASSGYVLPR